EIHPVAAVGLLRRAMHPVRRPPERMVLEREQRRDVAIGDEPHVAALASVTAVGSALGDVRLAPERHRAGAAVACLHMETALVDEARHRRTTLRSHPVSTVGHMEHVAHAPVMVGDIALVDRAATEDIEDAALAPG